MFCSFCTWVLYIKKHKSCNFLTTISILLLNLSGNIWAGIFHFNLHFSINYNPDLDPYFGSHCEESEVSHHKMEIASWQLLTWLTTVVVSVSTKVKRLMQLYHKIHQLVWGFGEWVMWVGGQGDKNGRRVCLLYQERLKGHCCCVPESVTSFSIEVQNKAVTGNIVERLIPQCYWHATGKKKEPGPSD